MTSQEKRQRVLAQLQCRRTLAHPDRCDHVDMELDHFQHPPIGRCPTCGLVVELKIGV